ncbi:MAG: antibiotic biosynthesis monooxygenase [Flavobacteriaceae bacterium]|nr:MAG: antibiotic biosynthesis monooxygenase [Flavobacteriaceae bacterium]
MFVRIVKMSLKPESVTDFLDMFDRNKDRIRNFDGCQFLELYRDKTKENIFFTYSYWEDETDLENYRNSELFSVVWTETKSYFNDRPEAWSVDKVVSLQ